MINFLNIFASPRPALSSNTCLKFVIETFVNPLYLDLG